MDPADRSRTGASSSAAHDRRAAARLPQDALLKCNLGRVCDLSRTGMRLRCRKLPHSSILEVCLSDGQQQIEVKAELIWANKLGFRKYEIGLHFVHPTTEQLRTISQFAMYNRFNRSM